VSVNLQPHRRSSSFFLPMLLLRTRKRHALKALYYFCRAVDDSVDEAADKAEARVNLAYWRGELENLYAGQRPPKDEVSRRLGIAIWQFKLPRQPFEDFFQGMEFDCGDAVEIKTEQELEKYCYCVAGTVGLQAMRIFGVSGAQANAFAIALGEALQLTNILRDLRKDEALGRQYVPKEWRADTRSQLISKAEANFSKVAELEGALPSRPLIPALLMRDIYCQKLARLKQRQRTDTRGAAFTLYLLRRAFSYYFS